LRSSARAIKRSSDGLTRATGDGRKQVERLVGTAANGVDVDVEVAQDRQDQRVLLLEQGEQKVVRVDLRVVPRSSQLARSLDGLL
jgi:hypothetical protein